MWLLHLGQLVTTHMLLDPAHICSRGARFRGSEVHFRLKGSEREQEIDGSRTAYRSGVRGYGVLDADGVSGLFSRGLGATIAREVRFILHGLPLRGYRDTSLIRNCLPPLGPPQGPRGSCGAHFRGSDVTSHLRGQARKEGKGNRWFTRSLQVWDYG